jgi:hypothetical protein
VKIDVVGILPSSLSVLAAFGMVNAISGCARRQQPVVVQPVVVTQPVSTEPKREVVVVRPEPPPQAPREVTPPAPGKGYVWVPGAYEWDGDKWAWSAGHWVRPARGAAVWVPGQWRQTSGGWYWESGHWR